MTQEMSVGVSDIASIHYTLHRADATPYFRSLAHVARMLTQSWRQADVYVP